MTKWRWRSGKATVNSQEIPIMSLDSQMDQSYHLRSLDPFLPANAQELPPIDLARLPLACERIPPHVTSLKECALWQIQILEAKISLTEEDEDAIDDGFVLCDVSVIQNKLRIWRRLFPRIKPFFAVKCNPDVMAAAGENTNTITNLVACLLCSDLHYFVSL